MQMKWKNNVNLPYTGAIVSRLSVNAKNVYLVTMGFLCFRAAKILSRRLERKSGKPSFFSYQPPTGFSLNHPTNTFNLPIQRTIYPFPENLGYSRIRQLAYQIISLAVPHPPARGIPE